MSTQEIARTDEGELQLGHIDHDNPAAKTGHSAVEIFGGAHTTLLEMQSLIGGIPSYMAKAFEGVVAAVGSPEEMIAEPDRAEKFMAQADKIPAAHMELLAGHAKIPEVLSVYRQATAHGLKVKKAGEISKLAIDRDEQLVVIDGDEKEKQQAAKQQRRDEEGRHLEIVEKLQTAQADTVVTIREYKPTYEELTKLEHQLGRIHNELSRHKRLLVLANQRVQKDDLDEFDIEGTKKELNNLITSLEGEILTIETQMQVYSPVDTKWRKAAQQLFDDVQDTVFARTPESAETFDDHDQAMTVDEALEFIGALCPAPEGSAPRELTYVEAEKHLAVAMRFLLDPKVKAYHVFHIMGFMNDIFGSRIKQANKANIASLGRFNETGISIAEEASIARQGVHDGYKTGLDEVERRYQDNLRSSEARYHNALIALKDDDAAIGQALAPIAASRDGAYANMSRRRAYGVTTGIFAGAERTIAASEQGFNDQRGTLINFLQVVDSAAEDIKAKANTGEFSPEEAMKYISERGIEGLKLMGVSALASNANVYADAHQQATAQHQIDQERVRKAVENGGEKVGQFIEALQHAITVGTSSHPLIFSVLQEDHEAIKAALPQNGNVAAALADATDKRTADERAAARVEIERKRQVELAQFLAVSTQEFPPKPLAIIRAWHFLGDWLGVKVQPVYAEDELQKRVFELSRGEAQLAIGQ